MNRKKERYHLVYALRVCVLRIKLLSVCAEQVHAKQHGLIFRILADDLCFNKLATLNQVHDPSQLAELALEIEAVILAGHQQNVPFALIEGFNESSYIDVMHTE